MSDTLAIMRDVGYGCRDVGRPVLWFTCYIRECVCALQVLSGQEAEKVIMDSCVYDVKDLEGKPCWVEETAGLIKFRRMWKR